jgi:hypothetical protein
MIASSDPQLSSELQELYLQNKQWLSDVLFLEDETRFFQTLFNKALSSGLEDNRFKELQLINISLNELEERRNNVRNLVNRHQQMLEAMLIDQNKIIGLELISENEEVINEIKSLFISDKLIKKELYSLAEGVIRKDKVRHLLNS